MKGIINITVTLLLILVMSFAFSLDAKAKSKKKKSKINPWKHCGIGVMLFPDDPGFASISNSIWDWGTTATSSKISSPEDFCNDPDADAARFINDTIASIEEETAKGEGPHLKSVLSIFGCQEVVHRDIIKVVRKDYTEIILLERYKEMSDTEKAEAYYFKLENHISGQFANQCKSKII